MKIKCMRIEFDEDRKIYVYTFQNSALEGVWITGVIMLESEKYGLYQPGQEYECKIEIG